MKNINTGGSAFPMPEKEAVAYAKAIEDLSNPALDVAEVIFYSNLANALQGMTLRDYFAAKAMQGLVAGAAHDEPINLHGAAEWSYNMADAMLKAREA